MSSAKEIRVEPISGSDARRIIRALHYSGKVVQNSQLHLGVFLGGKCGGAMQFGPSMDKRRVQGLVAGTLWNEFMELNRMAFADWLPRNSESRAIGYAMRFLRKTYPWLKWIVSYADGCQCGDGTIYRASGFALTGIAENKTIWQLPSGETISDLTFHQSPESRARVLARLGGSPEKETGAASMRGLVALGAKRLPGFQLRYVYFLDPLSREKLTVPVLPFSEIARRGAAMYKGKSVIRDQNAVGIYRSKEISRAGSIANAPATQAGEGGLNPTPALQLSAAHG